MQETPVWFLGQEDPLEQEMATHSSTLAWRIPMEGGVWWATVHGVAKSRTPLSDFTFTFHFHAWEKEMATGSSVLAWRIPGTGEPGGLQSMGSHRVGHDWSDLAAAENLHLTLARIILMWWSTLHFCKYLEEDEHCKPLSLRHLIWEQGKLSNRYSHKPKFRMFLDPENPLP